MSGIRPRTAWARLVRGHARHAGRRWRRGAQFTGCATSRYLANLAVPVVFDRRGRAARGRGGAAVDGRARDGPAPGALPRLDRPQRLRYDSTALWMHLMPCAARRTAGAGSPVVLIAVPLLAVAVPVTTWLHGRWAVLPAPGACEPVPVRTRTVVGVVGRVALRRDPAGREPLRAAAAHRRRVGAGPRAVRRDRRPPRPCCGGAGRFPAEPTAFSWITLCLKVGVGLLVCGAGVAIGGRAFDRRGSCLMSSSPRRPEPRCRRRR